MLLPGGMGGDGKKRERENVIDRCGAVAGDVGNEAEIQ